MAKDLAWLIIVGLIVLVIVWAYVANVIRSYRQRKAVRALLPEVHQHLTVDKHYRVHLSNGQVLENVRFVGISRPFGKGSEYLPFPLHDWVAVELPGGKRSFIKPNTIRMYDEL